MTVNGPGILAEEREIRLEDIDAFIRNADPGNKLAMVPANELRERIRCDNEGLYTDFLFNIQNQALPIACPSGPMTFFDADPDCSVADAAYTWNQPNSIAVDSPVTTNIPTINANLMALNGPPVQAILYFLWTDNLPNHLQGHIEILTPGVKLYEAFLAGGSGIRNVIVRLNFPNNLPEGFIGKLEAILTQFQPPPVIEPPKVLVTTTVLFAKDHTPPTVSAVHTERTAGGLTVTATVSDPAAGVGQVRVSPTVNETPGRTEYLHWASGDFRGPTGMNGTFSSLRPLDVVALDLVADDGNLNATESFNLPVANTRGDQTVECTSPTGATVQLDGSRSTGPANITYLWTGPFGQVSGIAPTVQLPFGPSTVTLTVTDAHGFTGSQTSTFTVVDTTPPMLSLSVSPDMLWPPDHRMVPVKVTAVAQDVCDPNPPVTLTSVVSNEPSGGGSGHTADDIQNATLGAADFDLLLRAERAGSGMGRRYTITYTATDRRGNAATGTTGVLVPHDQGRPSR